MAWYDRKPAPQTTTEVLLRRIENLERRMRLREQTGPASLQLIDFEDYEEDLDNVNIGEIHVNWPGQHKIATRNDPVVYFHDGEWRSLGGGYAIYEIKVFEDLNPVVVGDNKFIWEIPEDLDGAEIIKVEGFITTPGGGSCQVDIDLSSPAGAVASSILSTKIIIEAGEYNSKDSATQPVVVPGTTVSWGDHLHINVDSASGYGLGIIVVCSPSSIASGTFVGLQGPPGGVIAWTGTFSPTTTYSEGEAVYTGGTTYVAIQGSSGITPGVTPGWEAYWMNLVEGHQPYGGFQVVINSGGQSGLDPGVKAMLPIPYDCEIIEATLLADRAGSVVVDLWTDTYGNYPPTNADSITASAPLTLSGAIKTTDVALTGWDKTLVAGDTIHVVIESVSGIDILTVGLRTQRP